MNLKDLSAVQFRVLADEHIAHFQRLLSASPKSSLGASVRRDECAEYLRIWQGIRIAASAEDAGQIRSKLSPEQKCELHDALDCGDYDEILFIAAMEKPA